MKNLFLDFIMYLKAVFIESGRWILGIFDIIGIILFFRPDLAVGLVQNSQVIRIMGGGIFLFSFLISNFTLFRKLNPQSADINSFLLSPFSTSTSIAIKMKYVGPERANDIVVMLSEQDTNGLTKKVKITQFFPENETRLQNNAIPICSMDPGEIVYFYPQGKEFSANLVTISLSFTGATSRKKIHFSKDFPITQTWLMS